MGPARWSRDERQSAWWSEEEDTNLWLQLISGPRDARMECFEGSKEPLRGWIGDGGNDSTAAPLEDRYPCRNSAPVVSAVLLAAFPGKSRPGYVLQSSGDLSRGTIHHLEFRLPDGGIDHIAWTQGLALPVDDGRPLTTDAGFVWRRTRENGEVLASFSSGGTYLRTGGPRP